MADMPDEDVNDLDAVVAELGIQESSTTPAEAVRELKAEIERLKTDAARWRALMCCPRIRMYGSAGIDPFTGARTEGTHVHFGADFWSEGNDPGEQSGERSTRWGKHALTALADAIIELHAAGKV